MIDPDDLARALTDLVEWAAERAPAREPVIRRRLREHLRADPAGMPVVTAQLLPFERPNFQLALDRHLQRSGRESELIGLSVMHGYRMGLAELAQTPRAGRPGIPDPGSVEYETVAVGAREILCVRSGLWLIDDDGRRLALMLKQTERGPTGEELTLEVMATERELAETTVSQIQSLMDELNVYRGKILEVTPSPRGGMRLSVAALPPVSREQIILPAGVLERIERHTLGFAERIDVLRAAGRHLKRGLLLHGPPGTGKTLTAMYLSAQMPGRTVLLLTGQGLHMIEQSVQLARRLAPAMVVLEDVDLVAMERGARPSNPVLFSLLNAMDGLSEDSDIIFILTTNRADVLEPALAARPGRIDQSVELPYPDKRGRAALIALYGEGLELQLADPAAIVDATSGTSPAFIRELMRRAALSAPIDSDGHLRVGDGELRSALEELTESRALFLGDGSKAPADGPPPVPHASRQGVVHLGPE